VRVIEPAVEIFPVLSMPDLDMHDEALGDLLKFVANPFDEHTVMADPLIDFIEPTVNPFESPVVPVQSLLNPAKPLVKVLNKFLIHTASAAV